MSAVVPSTLLWTRLVSDVEANAPWQKLRRSLLLLLQLLLVAILALLAARPFLERPAGLARDVVLVLDTSASMAATDVSPNRLEAAKVAALDALRDLPTGGKVSVDRPPTGPPGSWSTRRPTSGGCARRSRRSSRRAPRGDLGDALELAGKLAARSGDAQILVGTDGALAATPTTSVDAPIKVLSVGPVPAKPGDRCAGGSDGALGGDPIRIRQRREPGPRGGPSSARAVGRRRAAGGARSPARSAGSRGRGHRRYPIGRGDPRGPAGRGGPWR